MDREDWNKFVKVFNLDVGVTVRKEITKADVILSLLDEGQVAFKGFKGDQFLLSIKNFDIEDIDKILFKSIAESKGKQPKN